MSFQPACLTSFDNTVVSRDRQSVLPFQQKTLQLTKRLHMTNSLRWLGGWLRSSPRMMSLTYLLQHEVRSHWSSDYSIRTQNIPSKAVGRSCNSHNIRTDLVNSNHLRCQWKSTAAEDPVFICRPALHVEEGHQHTVLVSGGLHVPWANRSGSTKAACQAEVAWACIDVACIVSCTLLPCSAVAQDTYQLYRQHRFCAKRRS